MTRKLSTWAAIVVGATLLTGFGRPGPDQAVAAQARESRQRDTPNFVADPSWPRIPNGWVLGPVSSVAIDERDHVWVLHRPRAVVRPGQKTGPPVMEFDAAGNYVQGWGGPGPGYEWPEAEHGIFVDYKGSVWIGGQNDEDQILKFSKAGRFIMQVGRSGRKKTNQDTQSLWKPADMFVYPKTNELFVADGYGNKRIIVFDAETGAYKRMWGAFGNVPTDAPVESNQGGATPDASPNSARIFERELKPSDPGPPQFDTVHGVKISNDGFVYVADRGGKRVQVFTAAGSFVAQAFVDRWCEGPASLARCGNGQTVAGLAFSADVAQRFLYVASRSPARIWVLDRRTLRELHSFGRPGVAPGEFNVLHHLSSDSKGNLYATEVEPGRRIQKFILQPAR